MSNSSSGGNSVNNTESLSSKISKLTVPQLQTRDCLGTPFIHLIVKTNRPDLLRLLFKNKNTDLSIIDYENGWNCLHLAIFNHYFVMANIIIQHLTLTNKLELILKQKDREGYTALDLLSSETCYSKMDIVPKLLTSEKKAKKHRISKYMGIEVGERESFLDNCSELVINENENLVHMTLSPLTAPEFQVRDTDSPLINFKNLQFSTVLLSSKHTLLMTKDGFLVACGSNAKARLGIGNPLPKSYADFIAIPFFKDERCFHMAVSEDYSLVSCTSGVYAFGSNEYGCLGPNSESYQLVNPVVILNEPLVSDELYKLACSSIHAVAYTTSKVLMWGLNIGQMGFPSEGSTGKFQSQDGHMQDHPKELNFPYRSIKQILCTEKLTLILTYGDELHVYTNKSHVKLQLPTSKRELNLDHFKPISFTAASSVRKIVLRGDKLCLLYEFGNVYELSITDEKSPVGMNTDYNPRLPLIWKASKRHLQCRDVDMAGDGSVVICTSDGSVYRRVKRQKQKKKNMFKFNRVEHVNNVFAVCCDYEFRKFAFMKLDVDMIPLRFPSFDFDVHCSRLISQQISDLFYTLDGESFVVKDPTQDFISDDIYTRLRPKMKYNDDFPELPNSEGFQFQTDDGSRVPFHRPILAAASGTLRDLFANGSGIIRSVKQPDSHYWKLEPNSTIIQLVGFQKSSIVLLLNYIYTHVWVSPGISRSLILEVDDMKLMLGIHAQVKYLELYSSSDSSDLKDLLDTRILLSNNDEVFCYSEILKQGCEYLNTLFIWRDQNKAYFTRNQMKNYEVNLQHVSLPHFEIILLFLHGKNPFKLFDHVSDSFENSSEYINFVLDCIELSDELLVFNLKDYLQYFICSFVDLSNVMVLLRHGYFLHCPKIIDTCFWVIYRNLSIFLFDKEFSALINEGQHDLLKKMGASFLFFRSLRKPKKRIPGVMERNSDFMLRLFCTDLSIFNSIFVENEKHEPILELEYQLGQNRKLSSPPPAVTAPISPSVGIPASASSSSTTQAYTPTLTPPSSNISQLEDESAVTEDSFQADDFIEVVSRRRRSSAARKSSMSNTSLNSPIFLKGRQPSISEDATTSLKKRVEPQLPSPVPTITPSVALPSIPDSVSPFVKLEEQVIEGPSKTKIKIGTKKPSQRERKKQFTTTTTPVVSSAVSNGDTSVSASSSSAKSSRSITPVWNVKSNGNTASALSSKEAVPMRNSTPSLTQIMFEQELKTMNKNKVAKPERTLEEIQQEEEFLKWFNEESQRVQREKDELEKFKKGKFKSKKPSGQNRRRSSGATTNRTEDENLRPSFSRHNNNRNFS